MPPRDSINQKLTWGWAFSTGDPALDVRLEDAAQAAWPYARVCAWTYLSDGDAAHDLMDHALQNAARYASRHLGRPTEKLTARIKSVIRRRAKQLAAKKGRELSFGSLVDLEQFLSHEPEAEQRGYANELLERLSPCAQSIVKWRWLGYSWREIAGHLEMDHTAVRRAYFREIESLLRRLSQYGDLLKCD